MQVCKYQRAGPARGICTQAIVARKSTLPSARDILAHADANGRLTISAAQNASSDAIVLPGPGVTALPLVVRVTAIAEDGRANVAVLHLLSKTPGMANSSLEIVRGATARTKVIQLPRSCRSAESRHSVLCPK